MFKAISCIAVLCGLVVYYTISVNAQVAPTNSAAISGSVVDVAGKPVPNAGVVLTGPRNASTQTDVHGLFVFVGMPWGEYQLSVSTPELGKVTRSISVNGDTNIAIQYEPTSVNGLKTIAHVSANANASFNVTATSITQVSPQAQAFQGNTSWRTILEQIPGVARAGLLSGNVVSAVMADEPLAPMQVSINGTLPYETAVLLDDMPLISGGDDPAISGGAGTNLAAFSLNAFNTADVIRGPGANAPSIVDSIGGSLELQPTGFVSQDHFRTFLE